MMWSEISVAFTAIFIIVNFSTNHWSFDNTMNLISFLTSLVVVISLLSIMKNLDNQLCNRVWSSSCEKFNCSQNQFLCSGESLFITLILVQIGSVVLISVGLAFSILLVTGAIGKMQFHNPSAYIAFLVAFHAIIIASKPVKISKSFCYSTSSSNCCYLPQHTSSGKRCIQEKTVSEV